MNKIKYFSLLLLLISTQVFSRGGDDVGNGGFAYKQSVKILKLATSALEEKIRDSEMNELIKHPERRLILQNTLPYTELDKLSKKNRYRGGRKLAMDYVVNPATVIILQPYFEAFMGKTDSELEDASLEVQKRLLHEAAHIWGYNEQQAEKFSLSFLAKDDEREPEQRPTNQIEIKSNFCSCKNGKSDIINDCDAFCAVQPVTQEAILYVDTILGPDIVLNSKLGNLYNWCSAMLNGDATPPQCTVTATDGVKVFSNIPVTITPYSNVFKANINHLPINRTFTLKLVESKTGSNAQSKEFQIRRKLDVPDEEPGALKISSIGKYTCIHYLGIRNSSGRVVRIADNFEKLFYFIPYGEASVPIPRNRNGDTLTVCHDEMMYPGGDSIEYPRYEFQSNHIYSWDMFQQAFSKDENGFEYINKFIIERMLKEYGVEMGQHRLFFPFKMKQDPVNPEKDVTYILKPFLSDVKKSTCPTPADFEGNNPLFKILGDYISSTEGLYMGESELNRNNVLVTERSLHQTGFFINNGEKILAKKDDFHRFQIYFYYPIDNDPLNRNGRVMYKVKDINEQMQTTDRRIGCVPIVN